MPASNLDDEPVEPFRVYAYSRSRRRQLLTSTSTLGRAVDHALLAMLDSDTAELRIPITDAKVAVIDQDGVKRFELTR